MLPVSPVPAVDDAPEAVPVRAYVPVTLSYAPSWTIALFRLYGYSGYRSAICFGPSRLVIRERSISSCMLPRRSQAIALSQATESTGVHCWGV